MGESALFQPLALGRLELENRIFMAPMTRSRASDGDMPNGLMRDYYAQRASAGLIITEGVHPNIDGKGYCRTPGIYNAAQVKAWQSITQAVHDKGGKIALQLMHCGRVGHAFNKPKNSRLVAPSAIAAKADIYTEQGMQAMPEPKAMSGDDIAQTISDYRRATEYAFDAGFDAVELHCTSGYLPAQFLSTGTNQRNDNYGGSVINRCRFIVDVLDAMSSVSGSDVIGFRICPANPFNDLFDADPLETFIALLDSLKSKNLAYVHAIHSPKNSGIDILELANQYFRGRIIINDAYDMSSAESVIASRQAQAVSFGRHFIANPNLPKCFKKQETLASFDMSTLYTTGAKGYTDYE